MNAGPMAFMRGLTFPGGQQPVIKGDGVYLRYPRISDYVSWRHLGPLVLSLVGVTLSLLAFWGLQRYLVRRIPRRRVRRNECPFCGYPVRGSGTHCEGCGRDVVAECARCAAPRRVGTAHCAVCGDA